MMELQTELPYRSHELSLGNLSASDIDPRIGAVHGLGAQLHDTSALREHEELKVHVLYLYDVAISEIANLDVNVYRVTLASPLGSSWVARVFAYSSK